MSLFVVLVEIGMKLLVVVVEIGINLVVVVETINKKIKNETEYMNKYLKQIDANERFITADLGMKGTMQKALTEILDDTQDEKKMVHLLMFGAYDILQKNSWEY